MRGYPRGFQEALLVLVGLLVTTGGLLLPSSLLFRFDWELAWRLASEARFWVAVMHTGLSYAVVFVLGGLLVIHVRRGWRRASNRLSGMIQLLLWGVLSLSALGVFYAGSESWVRVVVLAHLLAGAALLLVFPYHAWRGRRLRHQPDFD